MRTTFDGTEVYRGRTRPRRTTTLCPAGVGAVRYRGGMVTSRKKSRKRPALPPVAFNDPVAFERLPLPLVHYPGFYGAVFAFAEEEGAAPALCECSREAVEHYRRLRELDPRPASSTDPRRASLAKSVFPLVLAERSMREPNLTWLRFEPQVCHLCTGGTPSLRYCHKMYGTEFIQAFGWYVKLEAWRLGISKPPGSRVRHYLPDVCPSEIVELIAAETSAWNEEWPVEYRKTLLNPQPRGGKPYEDAAKAASKRVMDEVENRARRRLGFPGIGDAWVGETTLARIVQHVLDEHEVLRHHRPKWLGGLELDLFVPALNLGIEYQGIQHYQPVEAWGGDSALADLQERDARKALLCEQVGVSLVCIDYDEPLTEDYIMSRLGL